MVISLKMSKSKWAIADLNQTISVKEQRVDGTGYKSLSFIFKVYSSSLEKGLYLKVKIQGFNFSSSKI